LWHAEGAGVAERESRALHQPISARIFAQISASSSEILPFLAARRFRQSKLLTWSANSWSRGSHSLERLSYS